MDNVTIQFALGLSAGSALIYEVVATHILFFYFIESSYSIATVLSVFLFGLATGSLSIHYLSPKIKNKKLFFATIQIIIAIYAFFILSNLTNIIPSISTFGTFLTSFLILLIPTFFLGAIFPLAGLIYKKEKKEIIGLIYSSDLFGAILGSLLAGFVLIPTYGAKIAVLVGGGLNLISAIIIVPKKYKIVPVALIVLLVIGAFNFNVVSIDNSNDDTEVIQDIPKNIDDYDYYSNSPYGVVTVKNGCLSIDHRGQCCMDYPYSNSELRMADYSLEPLEQYGRLEVLNIGLGCACTLNRSLFYNTTVDVVEINEKVVEANKMFTNVLDNPRATLIINDGLSYLRESSKIYDSVLIDIENPTVAHASNLYTVDAFKIINDSLSEIGNFALWTYNAGTRYYDILYYSLREAFEYVYSYEGVFVASKIELDQLEYIPSTPYEINTIDKNTLTDAYLDK